MKTAIVALGLGATLLTVAPTLALAAEADTTVGEFKALTDVPAPVQLDDKELAAIEGAGGCIPCAGTSLVQTQNGLVNLGVQTNTGNTNIASGNNIAVLSNAIQSSHLH